MSTPTLNHGGSTPDNPLISGASLSLRIAKQDADETIRKAWATADGEVFSDMTGVATVTEYEISVPIEAGIHLKSGSTPVLNQIHVTTSQHRHARADVYVVDHPQVFIALDGYDGSDWTEPLIYPLYDAGGG